jgi:hypothetical protein
MDQQSMNIPDTALLAILHVVAPLLPTPRLTAVGVAAPVSRPGAARPVATAGPESVTSGTGLGLARAARNESWTCL